MPSRHDLPNYLPSPARRAPTQEFDYQELVADPKFHAVVDEHRKNGSFAGLDEDTPEYNLRLKEIAVAFVRVVNEKRATLFRNRGILNARKGAFREAISCYNRALELSNNSPSRHVTLANRSAAHIKSQKYAEALEDAQAAALLCYEYSIAHSLMGYCHSRLGMGKEAVVNYNIALQLNPADVSSQSLLTEAKKYLISTGETVETIEALEAPFLAKREQEIAAIQAAATAALEVPVMQRMHRRYLHNAERVGSIQDMRKAGMPIDAGCRLPEKDVAGQNSSDITSQTKAPEKPKKAGMPIDARCRLPEKDVAGQNSSDITSQTKPPEKPKRLGRKLSSGSAQAFASLTKLPVKLKHALGKKNWGSSSSKACGPGQHLASDFSGLYHNVVEDAAGAAMPPTCRGAGSTPKVPPADASRGASNPLFWADHQRHCAPANSAPATRDVPSVGGSGVGVGGGDREAAVFCATEPSSGGPVVQSASSANGGGPVVLTSRDVQPRRRQQEKRPQRQGLPPETPPRTRPTQNAGQQRPGVHTAVARQQERSRRKSKDRQEREGRPRSTDAAPEDGGGGATPSLTPPSVLEDGSAKPPSFRSAPRLGPVQKKTSATVQATSRPDQHQQAPTMPMIVLRGIGPSCWVPEKSGYASSESEFPEVSPSSSRAVAAVVAVSDGDVRASSTLPNATTERDRNLGANAAGAVMAAERQPDVARSPEKAGWTTSGSISDVDVSESIARESGGDRLRLDISATTEVLARDEEGIEADGALRIVLDGDSDCGSVYESVTGREGRNAAVEGEKAQAATIRAQTPRMELRQADAQASSGKCLGGGTTAYDRRSADREGHTSGSSPAAIGVIASSMFADEAEPESSARQSVSVRAKIEMFERTMGDEEAKLKSTMGRTAPPRRLSRSFSERIRAHERAISAATTSNALPAAFERERAISGGTTSNALPAAFEQGCLTRSRSFQPPVRASQLLTAMATTRHAPVTETNDVWHSRGS